MLESDNQIRSLILDGIIRIEPLDKRCIRPASICLRLGPKYLIPIATGPLDVAKEDTYPKFENKEGLCDAPIYIPPKSFILGHTVERITLPRTHAAWISNLSGLARLGISVVLSSFVSPGFGEKFPATLTLEISNSLDVPVYLHPGMRICHLVLLRLRRKSSQSYDSQVGTYSHQETPRISTFFDDFSLKDSE